MQLSKREIIEQLSTVLNRYELDMIYSINQLQELILIFRIIDGNERDAIARIIGHRLLLLHKLVEDKQNNETERAIFKYKINIIIGAILQEIAEFEVVCDETTNPPFSSIVGYTIRIKPRYSTNIIFFNSYGPYYSVDDCISTKNNIKMIF